MVKNVMVKNVMANNEGAVIILAIVRAKFPNVGYPRTNQDPDHYRHKYYYSGIQMHRIFTVTLHHCTVLDVNTEMYHVTLSQCYPQFLHIV